MSETELAAPGAAADDVAAAVAEAPEAPETEGQTADAGQPAEAAADAGAEESESKRRRERRERKHERLEQRAREAESRLDRILRAAEAHQPPKEADYPDPIDYAAARGAYAQAQAAAQFLASEAKAEVAVARQAMQQAEQARIGSRIAQLQEEVVAARSVYADFDEALAMAKRPDVVSQELSLQILESDKAADLTYHLGKNPEVARELSSLFARNPVAAAMQLGRIEASLSRPKPRTQTNAPDPVTPVRGAARATPNPATMTAAEYRQWREAGGRF